MCCCYKFDNYGSLQSQKVYIGVYILILNHSFNLDNKQKSSAESYAIKGRDKAKINNKCLL